MPFCNTRSSRRPAGAPSVELWNLSAISGGARSSALGGLMLRNPSKKAQDCYRRAADCGEHARFATNRASKKHFRKMEERWLALARSHELAENVSVFGGEVRRFLEKTSPSQKQLRQTLRKEAGRWLRELREERGLSQRELAKKVGVEVYTLI